MSAIEQNIVRNLAMKLYATWQKNMWGDNDRGFSQLTEKGRAAWDLVAQDALHLCRKDETPGEVKPLVDDIREILREELKRALGGRTQWPARPEKGTGKIDHLVPVGGGFQTRPVERACPDAYERAALQLLDHMIKVSESREWRSMAGGFKDRLEAGLGMPDELRVAAKVALKNPSKDGISASTEGFASLTKWFWKAFPPGSQKNPVKDGKASRPRQGIEHLLEDGTTETPAGDVRSVLGRIEALERRMDFLEEIEKARTPAEAPQSPAQSEVEKPAPSPVSGETPPKPAKQGAEIGHPMSKEIAEGPMKRKIEAMAEDLHEAWQDARWGHGVPFGGINESEKRGWRAVAKHVAGFLRYPAEGPKAESKPLAEFHEARIAELRSKGAEAYAKAVERREANKPMMKS